MVTRSGFTRWAALVWALGWITTATAPSLRASVPFPDVAPPSDASGDAVFGVIETDPAGKPFFVRTDFVPQVDGQAYGWFVRVGEARVPVGWTEIVTFPAPAASWGDAGSSGPSRATIAADHRSAVVHGEAIPQFGVIYDFWLVSPGDPPGHYTIEVRIDGGREERFDFSLGLRGSSRAQSTPR